MKATDLLNYFKKVIRGLILVNIVLVLAVIIIVCSFLHYLSLYDFTNGVDQNVSEVDNIENSTITQSS